MAAYKKYGIPNFKFQIICICFNEDCDRYEEEYIKKFNTLAPNGYNIRCNGITTPVSDETRQLISKRVKESITDERRREMSERNKGKVISEEQKKLLSIRGKERWQNMTSKQKDEYVLKLRNNKETIYSNNISDKSREALQTRADANKKRVGQFQNNILLGIFESVSHAARSTNICHTTISKVCNKNPRYKTAGGFVWKFI